ncbi:hypothetical protein ASF83_09750 [Plantibacter sp. Leaf171]|uniref:hypothetical protein n=1 Tax=unclassified Plantibacter TaxID=2624265 RepID=UPI0006FF161F|nr:MULTISPECIES: hypothetical protein [unclassified Plantibacter]KQM16150.1 hypothetical protein ASE44_09770 [Plantibacter sp. Leaf1]KQQ52253.1 hypothetical protein ASF68_07805 [Plantibacter sp. Leaf314]KQR59287.1 hypothetical protein ASF83_09750 [Plantibacter sp. Leaf171]
MLGRKTFEQREVDQAKAMIAALVAGRVTLAEAGADPAAVAVVDPEFFTGLTLVLDRPFVHRVRSVIGRGPSALNELELIVESIIGHERVFTVGTVLTYAVEGSFTGLVPGETIRLGAEPFERLAVGVFAELEELFVVPA